MPPRTVRRRLTLALSITVEQVLQHQPNHDQPLGAALSPKRTNAAFRFVKRADLGESRTVTDMETRQVEEHPLRARVQASLRRLPPPIRKMLVIVTSGLLIMIGISLVWLPGPFTLPFVIAGVAILSTEYVWASSLLSESTRLSAKALSLLRDPWILLACVLLAAVAAITAYTVLFPGWWT